MENSAANQTGLETTAQTFLGETEIHGMPFRYQLVPGHGVTRFSAASRVLFKLIRILAVPLYIVHFAGWDLATTLTPSLFSEDDFGRLMIDHKFLGGIESAKHHIVMKAEPKAGLAQTQGERLASVARTFIATKHAFDLIGLSFFLDSGSLLGKIRHQGQLIPWDTDADTGIFRLECEEKFPLRGQARKALQESLPEEYWVEYFDCTPSKRLATRVVDRRTGFFVDVFAYEDLPEDQLTAAQKAMSPAWIHRVHWNEQFGRTVIQCPKRTLLPLKQGTFLGIQVSVPQDEVEYLNCQYKGNLEIKL